LASHIFESQSQVDQKKFAGKGGEKASPRKDQRVKGRMTFEGKIHLEKGRLGGYLGAMRGMRKRRVFTWGGSLVLKGTPWGGGGGGAVPEKRRRKKKNGYYIWGRVCVFFPKEGLKRGD